MDLFGLEMMGNYEARCVAKYDEGEDGLFVSTAVVSDSPYIETAIAHPDYKGGGVIIVENSETTEEARKAHERWITKMTTEPLPEKLTDVSKANLLELAKTLYDSEEEFLADFTYPRIRKEG